MDEIKVLSDDFIKNKIHNVRGVQVMLDSDLAKLYEVETKQLNKSVKRNIARFPSDFMFQLTKKEYEFLRFQNGTISIGIGAHRKYLPYVFTEQGVAILSGILKSKKAIEINIQIIRTFISMKKVISQNTFIYDKINILEKKQLKNDINFDKIFDLLNNNKLELKQGIFFDGQIFSAHKFVCDLINSTKNEVILIDNYVDYNTLILFSNLKKEINIRIYTKSISTKLKLDLKKFESQYRQIEVNKFELSHDRFLIIDEQVYYIGASLKDLGKKWFAFSKMKLNKQTLVSRL